MSPGRVEPLRYFGYLPFASFEVLDDDREAELFAEFWTWLTDVRRTATEAGLNMRAHCHSGPSAENRQLRSACRRFEGRAGIPTLEDDCRATRHLREWLDREGPSLPSLEDLDHRETADRLARPASPLSHDRHRTATGFLSAQYGCAGQRSSPRSSEVDVDHHTAVIARAPFGWLVTGASSNAICDRR